MKSYAAITPTAHKLAQFARADYLRQHEGRHILRPSDFSEADAAAIRRTQDAVKALLIAHDGQPWDNVLRELKDLLSAELKEEFFIGFKAQDQIISACSKAGITFTH